MTPTQQAEFFLDGSVTNFRNAKNNESIYLIALGLEQMAQGMQGMAVGLRAVYQKLEAIERSVKKTNGSFPMVR